MQVGFLAKREYINEYYAVPRRYHGVFYPDSGEGKLLAAQVGRHTLICSLCCMFCKH